MTDYKLVPVKPTRVMEWAAENYWNERRFKWLSGDPRTWAGVYQAMLGVTPDVQEEPVVSAPVAAQHRFRHPQKSPQDWSIWQPTTISLDRPSWEIDGQGFEVEYQLLYNVPQPVEQQPDVSLLVEALELISDTDPNDGTAWFHEVAYKALAAYRKEKKA